MTSRFTNEISSFFGSIARSVAVNAAYQLVIIAAVGGTLWYMHNKSKDSNTKKIVHTSVIKNRRLRPVMPSVDFDSL